MGTKITTLLITLSLTLQLGALSKKPDANANASAASATVVGLDGETDRKSTEADVKSSATPAASLARPLIKRSEYVFWNINRERPKERAYIEAGMRTDRDLARRLQDEQRIDEVIIPQAIDAANRGDFEALWEAYESVPDAPDVSVRAARTEILNALFQMPVPYESEEGAYSEANYGGLRQRIVCAIGHYIFEPSVGIVLQISDKWVDFLVTSPFLAKEYRHPYELACDINHQGPSSLSNINVESLRWLLEKKFKQFGKFEIFMVTAFLGQEPHDVHTFMAHYENELKQFSDEQRVTLCNIGNRFAWKGRDEVRKIFEKASVDFYLNPQLLAEYREQLRGHLALPRELNEIIALYATPYRYGVQAQLKNEPMVMADWTLIDDFEVFPKGSEQFITTHFVLNNNLFVRLPERMACKFPQMKYVLAQKGLLKIIPPSTFEGAHELEGLDLSYNFLTDIPDVIYSLPKLVVLNLEGNPLSEGAKQKYQAWQERRKKDAESSAAAGNGVAASNANANAAATSGKSS